MRFKRLLALLLAAALALAVLVGCSSGKNQSLSQMLLNLLDGQYQNVSVEIDSDLEATLRQAISESETDEEIRQSLEKLLGDGISFQMLGSGQQGDTAWNLIIYPGTDPNTAAQAVYLDLDKVFAALPDDGQYSASFAMLETENSYAILVQATVDKVGSEDKPKPVTIQRIEVTRTPILTYWVGEEFDPTGMVITATYSDGTTTTIDNIAKNGDQGVTWNLEKFESKGNQNITISYSGKTTLLPVTVKNPKVEEIKVIGYKYIYTAGEPFDPNGMEVTVYYSDRTTSKKINSDYNSQGVTWDPVGPLTEEIEFVEVTYTDPDPEKGSASTTVYLTVDPKFDKDDG